MFCYEVHWVPHCQVHAWKLFHQSQCGGKKSSTKLKDLFQKDIILDTIWIVFLIQSLHDVLVFKLDTIDVCNYKCKHKTYKFKKFMDFICHSMLHQFKTNIIIWSWM
jgi:hypothetical protein